MSDDLTRPLGVKEEKPKGRGKMFVSIILIIAAVTASAGILGWMFVRPQLVIVALDDEDRADETLIVQQDLLRPTTENENSPGSPVRNKNQAGSSKSGPATIQPAKPSGSILPKTPLPPLRRQEIGLVHLPDPELSERIGNTILPKRSGDNLRPMDVYSRPPATEGNFGVARVVLIVGGLGISQTGTQQAIKKLPGSVTLAFAPYGNSLKRWMQSARKAGHEILLQIPMEPFDYPANNPGEHTLRTDLDADSNTDNLNWLLGRTTNYVGVIGYQGGKFTTNEAAIKPVFDQLAQRGLLFVDDGSVKNSLAEEAAQSSLLPFARADIHIDTVRDRAKIKGKLEELAEMAQRTGLAIGYANAFPESIDMITAFVRESEDTELEITPASAIVNDPERKRL
ncbi:MAG: divergent polysaccharide deacetylase family protein [Rhizobiaceae bacterium]